MSRQIISHCTVVNNEFYFPTFSWQQYNSRSTRNACFPIPSQTLARAQRKDPGRTSKQLAGKISAEDPVIYFKQFSRAKANSINIINQAGATPFIWTIDGCRKVPLPRYQDALFRAQPPPLSPSDSSSAAFRSV